MKELINKLWDSLKNDQHFNTDTYKLLPQMFNSLSAVKNCHWESKDESGNWTTESIEEPINIRLVVNIISYKAWMEIPREIQMKIYGIMGIVSADDGQNVAPYIDWSSGTRFYYNYY